MEQSSIKNEQKKQKTWDEAINELQAFIIRSKKEAQQKGNETMQQAKEEQNPGTMQ